jgi:hypothetical protein
LLVVVQDKKMARQNLRLEMKIIHSTLPTETETETETLPFEFTTLNDTTPPFPFSPFAIRQSPFFTIISHLSQATSSVRFIVPERSQFTSTSFDRKI